MQDKHKQQAKGRDSHRKKEMQQTRKRRWNRCQLQLTGVSSSYRRAVRKTHRGRQKRRPACIRHPMSSTLQNLLMRWKVVEV